MTHIKIWRITLSAMALMFAVASLHAEDPSPNPKASASHLNGSLDALSDGIEPRNSADTSIPRFTWWDHLGTSEWVQYDFEAARKITSVEVYWFDDENSEPKGMCRVPASWKLLYRSGKEWSPVTVIPPLVYGVDKNKYNLVKFEAVETTGLRIEVTLQPGMSGGILEWRLLPALATHPAAPDTALSTMNWKTWSPDGPVRKQLVVLTPASFQEYVRGFQADYDALTPYFDQPLDVNQVNLNDLHYARETAYVRNELAFDWMQRNVPYFDCPDNAFREIYYFRHWMNRLHLKNNGTNFVVSEFIGKTPWADANNVITCPAGHQFSWLTWLDDPKYARSYMNYYLYATEANPRQFREWLADSAWQTQLVHPSPEFARSVLGGLTKLFESYRGEKVSSFHDLYGCTDWNDGFEHTISGSGVRTTINSYLYANARAIANLARQTGDVETQTTYSGIAATIKAGVQAHLWDDKDKFFKTYKTQKWRDEDIRLYGKDIPKWFVEEADRLVDVREISGYIPWQFNLPDDTPEFAAAWRFIKDKTSGFAGQNGLAGAQKDHPRYNIPTAGARWNGLSWFFATTQALTGLANLLNDYDQQVVDKRDYFLELEKYTKRAHYNVYPHGKRIRPWATEWVEPDKSNLDPGASPDSIWATRSSLLYYFHSGYTELVINGLVGIRPQENDSLVVNPLVPDGVWSYFCLDGLKYKGHYICVLWDADGTRYNKGKGLSVFVDGEKKSSRDDLGRLTIQLPPAGK